MRFEKQPKNDNRWAMASGWLIRPDIIVTAGHCAYDWNKSSPGGRAVSVKAYIGYHGKQFVQSSDVQFRHVKRIVTTAGWLLDGQNETTDVAFFQVDKAFTGIKPFQFVNTPLKGINNIGVVGYPADKRYNNTATGEQGAQMWEAYSKTTWDLAKSPMHTLDYQLSTYPGKHKAHFLLQCTVSNKLARPVWFASYQEKYQYINWGACLRRNPVELCKYNWRTLRQRCPCLS